MPSAFGLQTPKDSELSIPHTWYAKLTYILIVWIHHIPNRHSDGRTWIWATYLLVIDKKKLYSYNLQVFSFNPLHSNLLCPIYKLQIDATSLVSLHELLKVWIRIGWGRRTSQLVILLFLNVLAMQVKSRHGRNSR